MMKIQSCCCSLHAQLDVSALSLLLSAFLLSALSFATSIHLCHKDMHKKQNLHSYGFCHFSSTAMSEAAAATGKQMT